MGKFQEKKFLKDMYDGGAPYISPVETWINKDCQSNPSPWHQFKFFQVPRVIQFPFLTQIRIIIRSQHIINEVLSWIAFKDKGKTLGVNCLLRWLHWWYDFT